MISDVVAAIPRTGKAQPFVNAVQKLSILAGWTSALMILAAVALTCQMIFIRFALNGSTVWQTEIVIYLVIAATLIGLPFVQSKRGHVNVDLIPLALRGSARFTLAILTLSLSIFIAAVMLFYGFEYWLMAYKGGWTSDTVTAVPLAIPYFALPLGFGLFLFQLIGDLVALLARIDTPFDLED